jgi:hypothetical protein
VSVSMGLRSWTGAFSRWPTGWPVHAASIRRRASRARLSSWGHFVVALGPTPCDHENYHVRSEKFCELDQTLLRYNAPDYGSIKSASTAQAETDSAESAVLANNVPP